MVNLTFNVDHFAAERFRQTPAGSNGGGKISLNTVICLKRDDYVQDDDAVRVVFYLSFFISLGELKNLLIVSEVSGFLFAINASFCCLQLHFFTNILLVFSCCVMV